MCIRDRPCTEDSLADMDAKGAFCKSVLSTKVNRKLEKNGYLMLDTKKEQMCIRDRV